MRALAIVGSLVVMTGPALAKPPDLPVDLGGTCIADQPAVAEEQEPALGPAPDADPASGLCLDLFTPCLCQLLVGWWQQVPPVGELVRMAATAPVQGPAKLFQRAEWHFHAGNTSQALRLYRRIQAVAPASAWGQRAQRRQHQIETRSLGEAEGSEEAQEEPLPSPYKPNAAQHMLQNTIPLETYLDEPVVFEEEAPATNGGHILIGKWNSSAQPATGPAERR